jgi:hypothetical protein
VILLEAAAYLPATAELTAVAVSRALLAAERGKRALAVILTVTAAPR